MSLKIYSLRQAARQILILIFFTQFFFSACIGGDADSFYYSTPISPLHSVNGLNPITLVPIWKKKFRPPISGEGKKVLECSQNKHIIYVNGQLPDVTFDSSIYAFNNSNGNMLWYLKHRGETVYSDKNVYIADLNKISAINGENGKILWETSLPFFSRNISKLYLYNGKLYAITTGTPGAVVLSEDGKILEERDSFEGLLTIHHDLPEFYLHDSGPIFVDPFIIYLDSNIINVYDNKSRYPIIQVKDIVSNITMISNTFLYLSKEGSLTLFDPNTNKNITFATISPHIEFNNVQKALDLENMGFYICYSKENEMLYMLLGDSQELLSLKVNGLNKLNNSN